MYLPRYHEWSRRFPKRLAESYFFLFSIRLFYWVEEANRFSGVEMSFNESEGVGKAIMIWVFKLRILFYFSFFFFSRSLQNHWSAWVYRERERERESEFFYTKLLTFTKMKINQIRLFSIQFLYNKPFLVQ